VTTIGLEIVELRPEHIDVLSIFFNRIKNDQSALQFHPHAFSDAIASLICTQKSKDKYIVVLKDGQPIGYGMLRGWDEGFETPSLGIYVDPEFRGVGIAKLLMTHLHTIAKLSKATRVRLKVYKDNIPALQLYKKLGYVFDEGLEVDCQVVGVVSL
jgi:ribosomal protein S18 acetylase RimI-like enzyme